jgi:spermidine/putrescine transport system ATP-binding protein
MMADVPVPEIRLTRLTKQFGDVRAVDDVSLDIRSGEFFSLLGPSGCGKTTTLRMIGGFELPTRGRIELRGTDITTAPPDKRPVNMVFQNYALFPHLNVGDNVGFGLRRKKVPGAEVRRRVGEALELVHLTGYDRRRTNQLSGGQQQRIALARALVNRPNVLLLDEPLGALDLKLRKNLQLELKRIQVEVGITFVYVTHDQEEALTMSDRIAVMDRGKVEQVGLPEELYERPATRFVADFMGTTNLLRGRLEAIDGSVAQVRLEAGDRCRALAADGLAVGSEVELSIRPEAVVVAAPGDGGPGAIEGRIEQVAYLGPAVQYQIHSQGGAIVIALAPKTGRRFAVGDDVEVRWAPDDALVVSQPEAQPGGTE